MPEAATEKVAEDPVVTVRLEGCAVIVGAVEGGGVGGGVEPLLLSSPQPAVAKQIKIDKKAAKRRCLSWRQDMVCMISGVENGVTWC